MNSEASTPAAAPEAAPHVSPLRAFWRGPGGTAVRWVLALLPLLWLTRRVRWREVFERAVDVGPGGLAAAFGMLLLSVTVGAARWRTMMLAYGATETPSLPVLVRHYLVGFYFNMLPSGLAGDAVRAHRLALHMPDMATSLTVVFLERVAGLFGLCIVAASAMLWSAELQDDAVAQLLELGLLGALGLSAVVLAAPWALQRYASLRRLIERVPVLGAFALRIPPARSYLGLALAVLQSVATQSCAVLSVAFIVRPLAPSVSLLVCARVVPAIILATYIPLTPGGVGQRELVFQYMFGLVGVSAAAAVATSLLFFAEIVGLAVLGGLCLLAERALRLDVRDRP